MTTLSNNVIAAQAAIRSSQDLINLYQPVRTPAYAGVTVMRMAVLDMLMTE